jgi:hypothetical protein
MSLPAPDPKRLAEEAERVQADLARTMAEVRNLDEAVQLPKVKAPQDNGGSPPPPNYTRYNESVKLTATWLNTIAAGLFTVGAFAPAASLHGVTSSPRTIWELAAEAVGWCVAGTLLHIGAKLYLRKLRK